MIKDILREVRRQLIPAVKGVTGLPQGADYFFERGTRTNFRALSKDGYEKNALIYSCVNELASSASEAHLIVERKTKDGWKPDPEHGLQYLLDNPNPLMSAYEFWFNVMLYLSLAGKCFWEMEPSGAGRIVGLWLMRPDLVEIEAVRTKVGERTRKKIAGFRWLGTEGSILFPTDRVLYFKHPHPRDELDGWPPLASAARAGDTDNFATDFVQSFFRNAAVPFGIFKMKGHQDEEMIQQAKEKLKVMYGSEKMRWHDPLFLGEDSDWVEMGTSFKDMDFPQLRRITETRICGVFQVPPILVGAFVAMEKGAIGDPAYKTARKSFWMETLMPLYKKNAGIINRQLVPLFGGGIRVRWDFGDVEALQEDKNAAWERATAAFAASGITRNMFLEEIGKEPIEGHDVFVQPLMLQSIPAKGKPPALPGKSYLSTKSALIPEEFKETWAKAIDMVAASWEGVFNKTAAALFRKEKKELLRMLRKEGKASTKGEPFGTFLRGGVFYLVANKEEWIGEFSPLFAGLTKAQADNILGAYGISFDIDRPEVQQFLENYTMEFAKGIEGVSEEKLRALIMESQSEGWSVPDTRKAIMEMWDGFDRNRATNIARTETITSSNYGAVEAWSQAGIERKEWYTTKDGRQCGWCLSMHGKVISIRGNFLELGDQLTITDSEGRTQVLPVGYRAIYAPTLHSKCRCTVLAHFE